MDCECLFYTLSRYSFALTVRREVAVLWCGDCHSSPTKPEFLLRVLDALSLALGIHTLYYYMVTEYAKPFALLQPTW